MNQQWPTFNPLAKCNWNIVYFTKMYCRAEVSLFLHFNRRLSPASRRLAKSAAMKGANSAVKFCWRGLSLPLKVKPSRAWWVLVTGPSPSVRLRPGSAWQDTWKLADKSQDWTELPRWRLTWTNKQTINNKLFLGLKSKTGFTIRFISNDSQSIRCWER